MKIAAWITIGAYLTGAILLLYLIATGGPESPIEWGIFWKFVIIGAVALSWAIRTLKKENLKSKEIQEQPPEPEE